MNQQYKEVKSDDSLLDDDWVSVESYGEMILKEKNQNNNNTTISSYINNPTTTNPLLNNSLINNNNTATTINFTNNNNIATSSLINNLQSSSIISVPFKVDVEKEYIKKVQEQMEKEQLEEKERKEKYENFIENLKRKSSDSNSPISTLSSSYNAFYNSEYINMKNNDTSSNNSTVTMNNSNVNNNNFQSIPSSSFYNNNNFVNNNTSIPYLNKSITELGFKTEDEMECYLHCIEMGFNPIISKFSTEAYCGDKLKVFDCCDKYKQLLDMRFSDTEIQEALLVTDRKLDDAIDYLTQLQNMKINSSTNNRNSLNGSNGMMNNGNMYY